MIDIKRLSKIQPSYFPSFSIHWIEYIKHIYAKVHAKINFIVVSRTAETMCETWYVMNNKLNSY